MDIRAILLALKENGFMSTLIYIFKRRYSQFYNSVFSKKLGVKLRIDTTSRIKGVEYITLGDNFSAGPYFRLEAISEFNNVKYNPKIVIGDNVEINDFVHIAATNCIEIGNNVLIASKVYISDHSHGIYIGSDQSDPNIAPVKRSLTSDKCIVIEDNVWIGESVSILPGVRIGGGSIIGANSVVTKNIPPCSIAVGCPAKVIKKYDRANGKWIAV